MKTKFSNFLNEDVNDFKIEDFKVGSYWYIEDNFNRRSTIIIFKVLKVVGDLISILRFVENRFLEIEIDFSTLDIFNGCIFRYATQDEIDIFEYNLIAQIYNI